MSFLHTTEQIRNRTKTVTRRKGWKDLKPGDRFCAIVKGQGLKKGEKVERLALLECVSNRTERLSDMLTMPQKECDREGLPEMSPIEFIRMFCKHMGGTSTQIIQRIEFKYVDP